MKNKFLIRKHTYLFGDEPATYNVCILDTEEEAIKLIKTLIEHKNYKSSYNPDRNVWVAPGGNNEFTIEKVCYLKKIWTLSHSGGANSTLTKQYINKEELIEDIANYLNIVKSEIKSKYKIKFSKNCEVKKGSVENNPEKWLTLKVEDI